MALKCKISYNIKLVGTTIETRSKLNLEKVRVVGGGLRANTITDLESNTEIVLSEDLGNDFHFHL